METKIIKKVAQNILCFLTTNFNFTNRHQFWCILISTFNLMIIFRNQRQIQKKYYRTPGFPLHILLFIVIIFMYLPSRKPDDEYLNRNMSYDIKNFKNSGLRIFFICCIWFLYFKLFVSIMFSYGRLCVLCFNSLTTDPWTSST